MTARLKWLVPILGLLVSLPSMAQQAEDFGDYLIHYNTMNTSMLSPEVASAYGIQRSGTRALLNIAVLKKQADELNTPVTARVSATATNLAGQRRDLDMQEIRDQDAIYYIGTFRFHNEEHLNFRVTVQPEGQGRSHEFSFRHQFYSD
jgi:hypothetical protein